VSNTTSTGEASQQLQVEIVTLPMLVPSVVGRPTRAQEQPGTTPPVLAGLLRKWGGYCRGVFEDLAALAPKELADLIATSTLEPKDLTYAAEILGSVRNPMLVVPTLLPLLGSPSPVVREGAVYGLALHLTNEVTARLRNVSEQDASPGVRTAARDILDENA
jgi:hypothetical protein